MLFCYNLPFEKSVALCLNKLIYPSLKNALCQVWLKLTQCFWSERFLYFVNVFLLFCNYFRSEITEKGGALHLNELFIFLNYLPLDRGMPFILKNLNPHHPSKFQTFLVVKMADHFFYNWQTLIMNLSITLYVFFRNTLICCFLSLKFLIFLFLDVAIKQITCIIWFYSEILLPNRQMISAFNIKSCCFSMNCILSE